MQTTTNPLDMIHTALGIDRDSDKLAAGLPDGDCLATIGITERDGQKLVWLERVFKNEAELLETLAAQAADPSDPNPLPAAVAIITFEPEVHVQLSSLDYNPVSGLAFAEEAFEDLYEDDDKDDLRTLGNSFLEDLFYPR